MTSLILFRLGTVLYTASAYLYLVGWFAQHRLSQRWAPRSLLGAVVLHGGAVLTRSLGYGFPFLTIWEVLAVYSLVLALLYLILEARYGYTIIGVLAVPMGTLVILGASFLPAAREPLLPMLQSAWLMAHIGVFFGAYAAFTLAFAAALAYLLQERALRRRQLAWRLPPLTVMDDLSRWLVMIGILLMGAALITGSTWAERTWGTPWVWEPKQVLSLVTLAIYGLYFFARHMMRWSARRASWLVVVGFISVIVTFVGADLVAARALHTFLFR
jgi:ABC-type transport system involved in cytochrome c biogenesis permease subunit